MNNAPTSEWKIVKPKSIKKGNNINALQLPPKSQTIIAKGDSAASNHYWALRDSMVLDDVEVDPIGPTVILPDTSTLTATKQGNLPIQQLSSAAKKTAVFDNLQSSLISLGQLCDDGCTVVLTKKNLIAAKDKNIILQGHRSTSGDGLWDIPISSPKLSTIRHDRSETTVTPSMNVIIRRKEAKRDLIRYLHGACFSPTKATWIAAINNGHFTTWPGLTTSLVTKYLPPSIHTAKGHLNQEKSGLQSTSHPTDDLMSSSPSPPSTKEVVFALVRPTSKAYMDATGRFPHCSSRGNEYVLIGYHTDANAILGIAMKNRRAATITAAWKELHKKISTTGVAPSTWILDNETSGELQNAMEKSQVQYQLAPPHTHRANTAERAIQTFKNHFKSGLASLDPDFPVAEWDRLLDQAFLSLNLLRTATANRRLSAYAYLFGQFDFNATPLAPPGTKVLIHSKPANRASWDPNGKEGWYIGPAPKHYRCMKCFLPSTRSEVISDTLSFFPHEIPFPKVTTDAFLRQAAMDIVTILSNPPTTTPLPGLEAGDETSNAILQLANILNRNEIPTPKLIPLINRTAAAAANLQKTTSSPTPVKHISPWQASPPIKITREQLTRVMDKTPQSPEVPYRPRSTTSPSFRHRAARALLAQHIFQPVAHHIYDVSGRKQSLTNLLNGPTRDIWFRSVSNEFGRLAQGNTYGVKATDTIDFIYQHEVPLNQQVTYASFVCDYRPLKSEPYRVRLVVGGDRLSYFDDAGAPAATMLETKILINSVISGAKDGARFMSVDLKDFFLATPMAKAEYMKISIKNFPPDIIDFYNLQDKISKDGYIYIRIKKGMYGLKQAAVLAYNNLVSNLEKHEYYPIPHTVGMWKHRTRNITFCLCVDDFGVKYYDKNDAHHLIQSLNQSYITAVDWEGRNFCGLNLDWHYKDGFVDISMDNYVQKVLTKFQHPTPHIKQRSPFKVSPYTPSRVGQRQYAPSPDPSPSLDAKATQRIQAIVGSLLYYARAIDSTLLPALNTIAASQASPTELTKTQCEQVLDYCATYPDVFIRYHASDMVLTIDSDAAYLVAPKARSRIAGYFQLNSGLRSPHIINGAILVECKTLRHVVASSAEAETAGIFHNAQVAIPVRYLLNAIGHTQPATPLKTDNTTAHSFVHNNITQKRSKSWDMRYYWLRDKSNQRAFDIHWDKADNNDADYFTKHHTARYHQQIRPRYVKDEH